MELSPRIYRLFVRPPVITDLYLNKKMLSVLSDFDFKHKAVLDFGCGIGSNSFMFDPEHYIGVDYDKRRVWYAKHLYPNYNFQTLMQGKLDIKDKSMDYVFISAVLHHIPTDVIKSYLRSFYSILKPKGQIIVIEPYYANGHHINNCLMSIMDRGKYIRTEENYLNLFQNQKYNTHVVKHFNKCIVYKEILFTAFPKDI